MHDELTKRILKNGGRDRAPEAGGSEGSPRRCKEARAQGDLSENFEYKGSQKV